MTKGVVTFELVANTEEQVRTLYSLLMGRVYSISHCKLPSFEEHEEFVRTAPYRYWYLISVDGSVVGSFYVQFDNSIGLNVNLHTHDLILSVLAFIRENLTPSFASASLVPHYFCLNVASGNIELQNLLKKMEVRPLQVSYKI